MPERAEATAPVREDGGQVPAVLDGAALRDVAARAARALDAARAEIDRLNVFPVPDGDTGSNLATTMRAARHGLADSPAARADAPAVGDVAAALARGALLGARGNAGTLLSQVLHGWAAALAGRDAADARALRDALRAAAGSVRAALEDPVEGTLLSVADAAATGADEALEDGGASPAAVGSAALAAAEVALARTPAQLPVLARAGVVDAGGQGLVVLLTALDDVLRGATADEGGVARPAPDPADDPAADPPAHHAQEHGHGVVPEGKPGYEVMYLLEATADAVARLRDTLRPLGDSLVVTGGAVGSSAGASTAAGGSGTGTWHVHVHVDDVGAAVEAGVDAGRPSSIRVVRLADVRTADAAAPSGRAPAAGREGRAVLAAVPPGLAPLVVEAGAVPVPSLPAVADLLAAVDGSAAECVLLVPPDAVAAAGGAAERLRRDGVRTATVPAGCVLQVLAALAVAHPEAALDDDVRTMRDAAGTVRCGELAELPDLDAARRLLDDLLVDGGELVTVVVGEGVGADVVPALADHLAARLPDAELVCYPAGTAVPALHVGVE